jgi:hypothetical protein
MEYKVCLSIEDLWRIYGENGSFTSGILGALCGQKT